MCGGGTQTTTQETKIPPEVMARYNAVNARAEEVAKQPFQQYSGEFVAPLSETQRAGIGATNQYAQYAQPAFQMGQGLTLSGAQDVGTLTGGQIGRYMNPFLQGVADPTIRALQQQQGRDRAMQQAQAIKSGAFGGDRAGIERAVLQGQQELATSQAVMPIFAQGYQSAVNTAQGQQGVVAADLARRMTAGQQLANLGAAGQQTALQGAQAQMQAGQQEQQTQQALDTAKYQQFLQQRGYDFQTAQFLANIAMGTGALSGSTTTTQQPAGFFSDERLKENIERVGKTDDGQPIYRYNYKGDNRTQIGLLAQDVEKDHPEAVGEAYGYKTVDYEKATDDAARSGRAYGGGLDVNAFGGAVMDPGSYAEGGGVANPLINGSLYGQSYVPAPLQLGNLQLMKHAPMPEQQKSGLRQAAETGSTLASIYKGGKEAIVGGKDETGLFGKGGKWGDGYLSDLMSDAKKAEGGGVVPREHYNTQGFVNPYGGPNEGYNPVADVVKQGVQQHASLPKPGEPPKPQEPLKDVMQTGTQLYSAGKMGMAAADKAKELAGKITGDGLTPIASGSEITAMPVARPDALGSLASASAPVAETAAATAAPIAETAAAAAAPVAEGAGVLGSIGSGLSSLGAGIGAAGTAAAEGIGTVLSFLPMLFSDERMKDNIRPVGKTFDGQNIYTYDFGDGRTQMGLIAQEVLGRHPDAVAETKDGLLAVDYRRATDDAAPRQEYNSGGGPKMVGSGLSEDYDWSSMKDDERAMARGSLGHKQPSIVPVEYQIEPGLGVRGRYMQADKYSNIGGGLSIPVGRGRADVDASYGWVRGVPQAPAQKSIMGRFSVPFAEGGVVPRQGYQEGGPTDPQQLFGGLEDKYDLPAGYLNRTYQIESGGGKNLQSDKSSARGPFQFITGTAKAMGLNNPDDLNESADAAARYAVQNRDFLRKNGIENPSAAQLYLAHQQGPLGAIRLLNSGDTAAGNAVGSQAVSNNAGDPSMRGLDFANQIMSKFSGSSPTLGNQVRAAQAEKAAQATTKDSGTNWEKILVPLLSGVGSAMASTRPTLGGALGEGLIGGIAGYKDISKLQAELPKTEAETQVNRSTADRINMATRALRAGMLDYKFIPDVGLQLFDKEGGIPITVTDKQGKPLPGAEKLVQEFITRNPTFNFSEAAKKATETAKQAPVAGTATTTSTPGAASAPEGVTSDIRKFAPAEVAPSEWTAVTKIPDGYQPDRQAAIMSPFNENRATYVERGNQQVKDLQQKALAAPDTQMVIDKMAKDFATINRNSFTATGPTAKARNDIAGVLNDAARVFGSKEVVDPADNAAFEGLQKGTMNLGFKTANNVTNSRVPFELVKSATSANPQIANSPLGASMLLRNIEQAVQLERDKAAFFADYYRRFQNTEQAQEAFEAINPASKYVDRGVYNGMNDFIPKNQSDYLREYVANNPDKKAAAMAKFDQQVGVKGAAKILLGAK